MLDLDAFERANKAEGLGVTDTGVHWKNLQDNDEICKLFRFLQLLCEGHNLGNDACPAPVRGHNLGNDACPAPTNNYINYQWKQLLLLLDFQNYLRTQVGNTTIVNIIICTVDYLLRL